MKIATTNEEKTVDQLVDRLVGSDDTATNRQEFRARLLEANPHLADVSALPPGTPLILPGDIQSAADVLDARVEAAYALARDAVGNTAEEIEAALQLDADTATAQRTLLDSQALKAAIAGNPEVAKRRDEMLQKLKAADAERETFRAEVAASIKRFEGVLKGPIRRRVVAPVVPPPQPVEKPPAPLPPPPPPSVEKPPEAGPAPSPPVVTPSEPLPPPSRPVEKPPDVRPAPAPPVERPPAPLPLPSRPVEKPPDARPAPPREETPEERPGILRRREIGLRSESSAPEKPEPPRNKPKGGRKKRGKR